jgi:hypothetical protein
MIPIHRMALLVTLVFGLAGVLAAPNAAPDNTVQVASSQKYWYGKYSPSIDTVDNIVIITPA